MPRVVRTFISYRRVDNPYLAADVRSRLVERFGKSSVFLDTDSIPLGRDFRAHVRAAMDDVDVVLVLVGSAWQPERLQSLRDPVRNELLIAHSLGKRIIPVLHSGRQMPTAKQLPRSLAWFSYLNAFEIGAPRTASADIDRLMLLLLHEPTPPVVTAPRESRWRQWEHRRPSWLLPIGLAIVVLAAVGVGAAIGMQGAKTSMTPGSTALPVSSSFTSSGTSGASTSLDETAVTAYPPDATSTQTTAETTVSPSSTVIRSTTTPRPGTTPTPTAPSTTSRPTTAPATSPSIRVVSLQYGKAMGLYPSMKVQSAGFDPTGTRAYALGFDQLRLSDSGLLNWSQLTSPTVVQPNRFVRAAFSPDSNRIAASSADGHITIWSTTSRSILMEIEINSNASDVVFDWSPDGKLLVAADNRGTVGVWSSINGAAAWTENYWSDNQTLFRAVAWSPQGDAVAAGARNGKVVILSASNGEALPASTTIMSGVNDLAWAPDGSVVAAATDVDVHLVRMSGAATTRLRQPWVIYAMCFDPTRKEIIVAGKSLQAVNASTGERTAAPAASLNGRIFYDISCSPDGASLLAVTGSDVAIINRVETT